MGKKDWEKLTDADDLSAIGISKSHGRGWKVFSGLLFVGAGAFVAAYYLPLYRAHSKLVTEYQTASTQASTFHQQLTDTIGTLNHTTEECDKLRTEVRKQNKEAEALAGRAERLERSLQPALKKFLGKGKLTLERNKEQLRVALAAPAAVAATGGDLTDFGKKALCAVGASLKDADTHVVVLGLGVAPNEKSDNAWQLAAARAGNAAQHLSKSCGVESSRIKVAVSAAPPPTSGPAVLALEIAQGS